MHSKRLTQTIFLAPFLLVTIFMAWILRPHLALAGRSAYAAAGALPAPLEGRFAIAYVGMSADNQQIRLISPDGSDNRLLWQAPPDTDRLDGIGELSWRSDAGELAFDSGHDWQRSMNLRDIYALAPDGTGFRRLTRPPSPGDTGAYPGGTVTFMLDSYASGDVQIYIEGADEPVSFFARLGATYQITQTLADLGENVRQHIRLYDPDQFDNSCNYHEEAWVDVAPGQVVDAGWIRFGVVDDYTCPQTTRPAWMLNSDELLYLFAEPDGVYQSENNIWRVRSDAPPASMGARVLDYGEYPLAGRLFLVKPGRTPATANQLLAGVYDSQVVSSIFRAPIDDARQQEAIDLGLCAGLCTITGLAWLPDGAGFVFSRFEEQINASGEFEASGAIYRYTFAGQQMVELYRIQDFVIGRLDVSPDGSQIVFERSDYLDERIENLWLNPLLLCPCQIWIVDSDGANAHMLVGDGRAPVWSPAPLPPPAATSTPAPPPTATPVPTTTPPATPTPPPGQGQSRATLYLPILHR